MRPTIRPPEDELGGRLLGCALLTGTIVCMFFLYDAAKSYYDAAKSYTATPRLELARFNAAADRSPNLKYTDPPAPDMKSEAVQRALEDVTSNTVGSVEASAARRNETERPTAKKKHQVRKESRGYEAFAQVPLPRDSWTMPHGGF
jgi:hypothetical protein